MDFSVNNDAATATATHKSFQNDCEIKELQKLLTVEMFNTIHSEVKQQFTVQKMEEEIIKLQKDLKIKNNNKDLLRKEIVTLDMKMEYQDSNRNNFLTELQGTKEIMNVLKEQERETKLKLDSHKEINNTNKCLLKRTTMDLKSRVAASSASSQKINKDISAIQDEMNVAEIKFRTAENELKSCLNQLQETTDGKKSNLLNNKMTIEKLELNLAKMKQKITQFDENLKQSEVDKQNILQNISVERTKNQQEINDLMQSLRELNNEAEKHSNRLNKIKENQVGLIENLDILIRENNHLNEQKLLKNEQANNVKQQKVQAETREQQLRLHLQNTKQIESERIEGIKQNISLREQKIKEALKNNATLSENLLQLDAAIDHHNNVTLREIEEQHRNLNKSLPDDQIRCENMMETLKAASQQKRQKISDCFEEEKQQADLKTEREAVLESKEKLRIEMAESLERARADCETKIKDQQRRFKEKKEAAAQANEKSVANAEKLIKESELECALLTNVQNDIQKWKKSKLDVRNENIKLNYLREKTTQLCNKRSQSPPSSHFSADPNKSPQSILKKHKTSSSASNPNRVTFNDVVFVKSPSECGSITNPEDGAEADRLQNAL